MKKIVLFIVTALLIVSCGSKTEEKESYVVPNETVHQQLSNEVAKITVEGHDYLMFTYVYDVHVLHSASCPATHEPGRVY